MTRTANPHRGEARLVVNGQTLVLRPTFAALVNAEEELGSLFALVERAAEGKLKLAEMSALFWHCAPPDSVSRDDIGAAVMAAGLAGCTPQLRMLLGQILQGSG